MTGPPERDTWISAETERKERHFRGIMHMHATACKNLVPRSGVPYLYADLYAGPGSLHYQGRQFDGSPLIARDVITRAGLPYQAVHFECDPEVAGRLHEALYVPASLFDTPDPVQSPIITGRCQDAYPEWLASAPGNRERLGLVYSDPVSDPIPVDLLNLTAGKFPHVDLLAYVAANDQYKRKHSDKTGGRWRQRHWLADDIRSVRKSTVLIRRPFTAHQWTFLLWTNWEDFPVWETEGFYRLDDPIGQMIFDKVNLTAGELADVNSLPFSGRHYQWPEPGDRPYHSYREYLRHPRFREIRAKIFARAAGTCERCRRRPPTEAHHLRYPPWGAFDVPENLIAVCHPCHCEIHGKTA